MKKTIISLLLGITLILSMSANVFAGGDDYPQIIRRVDVEQVVSE